MRGKKLLDTISTLWHKILIMARRGRASVPSRTTGKNWTAGSLTAAVIYVW
jgi:hypothetical protein